MGINIGLNIYKEKELYKKFVEVTKTEDTEKNKELFRYVLRLHGFIFGEHYVILNNEYYEESNLYYEISNSLLYAFDFIKFDEEECEYEEDSNNFDIFSKVFLALKLNNYYPNEIQADDFWEIREKINKYKEGAE